MAEVSVLRDQFETWEEQRQWRLPGFQLEVQPAPPPYRLQISNTADDRLVQVQRSRFLYNWRKGGEYPSYHKIRPEFDACFDDFCQFVNKEGLGKLVPNQWEITYVNQIPKGDLWATPRDWRKMLPTLLADGKAGGGTQFETVSGQWRFEIEPRRGRLHVALQHGRTRPPNEVEVLVFQLTARGPITDQPGLDLDFGLKLGHDMIVRSFEAMTSAEAHQYWGRRC